ncbi:tol-pal system protein YbgF [Martelella lutilitoris]|uniref:Cell division coordinator CpoB n=1 Tax=Martelella lutilitoris TaxID=2583532 RepID=A0A7T7HMI3_9HYPH|nr:tol-pal system protein YbgF [Martelella lutilitoris]QQM31813.1 tol-pal system protein YbgF [Martelella lutilitoris]
MRKAILCLLAGSAVLGMQASASAAGLSLFPATGGGQGQVVQVQATDPAMRIMQLEEQVRNLNGQVEDLSFQLLQMEERIRKLQEDMEFRLQDLESGMAAPPSSGSGLDSETASIDNLPPMPDSAMNDATMPGEVSPDLPEGAEGGGDDAAFYNVAYNLILSGDYQQAEDAFGEFVLSYPNSPLIPDASFWLGESMLAQQKFNEAAKTFLNAYKAYGTSDKAPEMLLKLGQSLAGMDNKDAACATFAEVPVRYPDAARAVLDKASAELTANGC